MSQENVAVVKRLFEATTQRDADAAWPLLHPEIEWDMSAFPFPDLAGVFLGREEVLSWWVRYFEAWDQSGFEILDVAYAGEDLIVETRAWGLGRDGIEIDRSFVNLMTVSGGRLVRERAFQDRAQALEAVGLSE
jgi:ketosteroid isomerase-like protein